MKKSLLIFSLIFLTGLCDLFFNRAFERIPLRYVSEIIVKNISFLRIVNFIVLFEDRER